MIWIAVLLGFLVGAAAMAAFCMAGSGRKRTIYRVCPKCFSKKESDSMVDGCYDAK